MLYMSVLIPDAWSVVIGFLDIKTVTESILPVSKDMRNIPAFIELPRLHWIMQIIKLYRKRGRKPPKEMVLWMLRMTRKIGNPKTPYEVSLLVQHVNRWLLLGIIKDSLNTHWRSRSKRYLPHLLRN